LRTEVATYNTVAGQTTVTSGTLAYLSTKHIIKVKREGIGYDIIASGVPGNRQVLHTPSTGTLTFDTPHSPGAKVYVLYQD
jgi:hypothetical protein